MEETNKPPKKFMSHKEYAAYRGVTIGRISQLKEELKRAKCLTRYGNFNVEKCDEYLAGRLDMSKCRKKEPKQNETPEQSDKLILSLWDSHALPDHLFDESGNPLVRPKLTESEARTLKILLECRKSDQDFKEKQRILIDSAEANRTFFTRARSLRDAILNVPSRVSAKLAAETDEFKIEQELTKELKVALGGEIGE